MCAQLFGFSKLLRALFSAHFDIQKQSHNRVHYLRIVWRALGGRPFRLFLRTVPHVARKQKHLWVVLHFLECRGDLRRGGMTCHAEEHRRLSFVMHSALLRAPQDDTAVRHEAFRKEDNLLPQKKCDP